MTRVAEQNGEVKIPWSDEEKAVVLADYRRLRPDEIAKKIGRSRHAVIGAARRFGLAIPSPTPYRPRGSVPYRPVYHLTQPQRGVAVRLWNRDWALNQIAEHLSLPIEDVHRFLASRPGFPDVIMGTKISRPRRLREGR